MKDSQKLQQKLHSLLRKYPNIKVNSALPWDDLTFREIVWVVQDYVNNSGDVTNEDPLQEWLDEYSFFVSDILSARFGLFATAKRFGKPP